MGPIPTLVINLKRSRDRWTRISVHLAQRSTWLSPVKRVEAVDALTARETTLPSTHLVETTRLERAVLASHLKAIRLAAAMLERDEDVALILEDDASFEWEPYWDVSVPELIERAVGEGAQFVQLCGAKGDLAERRTVIRPWEGEVGMVAYAITGAGARFLGSRPLTNVHSKRSLVADDAIPAAFGSRALTAFPSPISFLTSSSTVHDQNLPYQIARKRACLSLWRRVQGLETPPRRVLWFSSVGNNNLNAHRSWGRVGSRRTMDVWIAYYGKSDTRARELLDVADEMRPMRGTKWQNLHRFANDPELGPRMRSYDYVIVADDDLQFPHDSQVRWLAFVTRVQPFISAPSFKIATPQNWDIGVRKNNGTGMRWTNFVECTCPCFRADALATFLYLHAPVLAHIPRGFGVDVLMQNLMWCEAEPFAILDVVSVYNPTTAEKEIPVRECERAFSTTDTHAGYIATKKIYMLPGLSKPRHVKGPSRFEHRKAPHRRFER